MIEIFARRQAMSLMVEIFIMQKPAQTLVQGDYVSFFHFDNNGLRIITKKVFDEGCDISDIKPSMILPEMMWREMLNGWAKHLKNENIQLHDESTAKGKLEATEKHLADLRQMLKLK